MGGIFTIILILSLAGNALIGKAYLGARDNTAKAKQQAVQSQAVAQQCSDATEGLVKQAEQRGAEGAKAAASAAQAALPHKQRAQRILASKQSSPGNACKSAEDAIDDWLRGRSK